MASTSPEPGSTEVLLSNPAYSTFCMHSRDCVNGVVAQHKRSAPRTCRPSGMIPTGIVIGCGFGRHHSGRCPTGGAGASVWASDARVRPWTISFSVPPPPSTRIYGAHRWLFSRHQEANAVGLRPHLCHSDLRTPEAPSQLFCHPFVELPHSHSLALITSGVRYRRNALGRSLHRTQD